MAIEVTVELSVEELAKSIARLKKNDKEMLLLLLSKKGKEIEKRVQDIKSKKVKTLTREEILKDVI